MARTPRRSGSVIAYDEHAGLGRLRDLADGSELDFHCTALNDGTRTVAVGAEVSFETAAGQAGRIEAANIDKLTT